MLPHDLLHPSTPVFPEPSCPTLLFDSAPLLGLPRNFLASVILLDFRNFTADFQGSTGEVTLCSTRSSSTSTSFHLHPHSPTVSCPILTLPDHKPYIQVDAASLNISAHTQALGSSASILSRLVKRFLLLLQVEGDRTRKLF